MKALCWQGKKDIRYETVPDPRIEEATDAIVRVTSTAICGSDLHLYNGSIPTMVPGDVVGHEFMGEVVEVGSAINRLRVGDRVIVPFTIWCGECEQCRKGNYSVCQRSNRNKPLAEKLWGHTCAGLFGYSHITGGYAGGQAEYVRVPWADNAPVKVPSSLRDDQVLFLTDIFPTGWQGAAQADIQQGDTVAVWGCGPVAQFVIRSAFMLGAERVIAIDDVRERLEMARQAGAEPIDFQSVNVLEALNEMTNGSGPDKCIEAVGMEAHGHGLAGNLYDFTSQAMKLETGRPIALREAIMACKPGGVVSVPGVYGGLINAFPMGAFVNKSLTMRSGQTHVNRWTDDLLRRIEEGQIDPSFVVTHRATLKEGPALYRTFRDKREGCIKVVMQP
jgi:threonine dehydrogenase-like Zn-dependent dehydrogenase